MDRITPILDSLNHKVVFPFRDVPVNGWAVVPKNSPGVVDYYFPESRELYDSALMIGEFGMACLYAGLYEIYKKKSCVVFALSQIGWSSPGEPLYMWRPLISYHPQTLSADEYQRIYDSRGWYPWLDDENHQMADSPLRSKWVRLGVIKNEDRFITHEPAPDNIIFFPVPQAANRAAWLKKWHKKGDDWERAYNAAFDGK